jgi:hypothetical protein
MDNLTPSERRIRLLDLLRQARARGTNFVPVGKVDNLLLDQQPATFLKHDIHHVVPSKLLEFAQHEMEMGVIGTYFFMSFGHPSGAKYFSADDQVIMMREVAELGHEIGAHFDPLYDTRHHGKPLADALTEQLDSFGKVVGHVSVANLHGNTGFKIADKSGNNLVFELFDELARQPDYPQLCNVSSDVADFIRENRASLRSFNLSHWGDSWIWSREHGLIATGLVTDNWMGRDGVIQMTVNPDKPCAYGLDPRQDSGSHSGREPAKWVAAGGLFPAAYRNNVSRVGIFDEKIDGFFQEALPAAPFVMLLHPQFYAV